MLTTMDGVTYKSGGYCEGGIISSNTGHCNLDTKPVGVTQTGQTTNTTGTRFTFDKTFTFDEGVPVKKSTNESTQNGNENVYQYHSDYSSFPESNLDEDYVRINQSGASGNTQDDINTEVKKAVINIPVLVIAGLITAYILGAK